MLDLLRATNQGGIAHRALVDALNNLLAFLHKTLHRRALDALQADAKHLYYLVDALDLALGFFQVRFESRRQIRVLGRTGQAWEGLGQLLLGAVDV